VFVFRFFRYIHAGWTDEHQSNKEWAVICYKPRPKGFCDKKAILILDAMTSHKDETEKLPRKEKNTPKSQIQKLYSTTFSSSSYFIPFLSCCVFLFILRYIILITDEKGQNRKMIDEVKILKAPPQKKIEVEKRNDRIVIFGNK
jgi:hypothetical protein